MGASYDIPEVGLQSALEILVMLMKWEPLVIDEGDIVGGELKRQHRRELWRGEGGLKSTEKEKEAQ